MRFLMITVLSVLSFATFAQEGLKDENLLQAFPLPVGEWEAFAAPDRSDIRWIEKSDKEMVRTTIARGKKIGAAEFRDFDDSLGKKNCATFETTLISDAPTNGYPALLWKTRCAQTNRTTITLARFISGNDAAYIVRKSWLFAPSEADIKTWQEYLESVSACDTRGKDHPCPPLVKP